MSIDGKGSYDIGGGSVPVDKFRLIYLIFGWLGIGTLLPWNMFITVSAYWTDKWKTVDTGTLAHNASDTLAAKGNELNAVQLSWNSNMAMASMVPNVTFLLLNASFGHHFKTTPRLLISLIFVILLFGLTCAMTKVDTDPWQDKFWIGTIISIVLININSAIFQGGLLGLAGKFPPQYMGIVFGGQAFGGIFASVTNVLVILMGVSPANAAFFCFLVAVIFLGTALFCFLVATRSEFFQYYLDEKKVTTEISNVEDTEDTDDIRGKFLQNNEVEVKMPTQRVLPWMVFRTISVYGISVFLIFTVTLACFPAITVLVKSSSLPDGLSKEEEKDYPWGTKFFIPVCCFVLFNVGDWLGRFSAEMIQWPKPGRFGMFLVLALSLLRLAFIPLFLFCNINIPVEDRHFTFTVFGNEAFYIIFMALFSLSNGYLSCICMMSAPQLCKGSEAQTASSMMVALLGLGLGTGSLMSYPIKSLL
jgi:equilibrative nucleoside transporter 1/2/3